MATTTTTAFRPSRTKSPAPDFTLAGNAESHFDAPPTYEEASSSRMLSSPPASARSGAPGPLTVPVMVEDDGAPIERSGGAIELRDFNGTSQTALAPRIPSQPSPPPPVFRTESAEGRTGQSLETQKPTPRLMPVERIEDLTGSQPVYIYCPWCKTRALTKVATEGSGMQLVAGAACFVLCVFLTCVPCIAGWFENTTYYCSSCRAKVATRHHGGGIQTFLPKQQAYAPVEPMQVPLPKAHVSPPQRHGTVPQLA